LNQKIDHHLFELTRTDRARAAPGLRPPRADDAGASRRAFASSGDGFAPSPRARRPIADEKLDRIEAQRLQSGKPRGKLRRLNERIGGELLGDVPLDADLLDVGEIFSCRAEGEAVQDVQDLPVGGGSAASDNRGRARDEAHAAAADNSERRSMGHRMANLCAYFTAAPAVHPCFAIGSVEQSENRSY